MKDDYNKRNLSRESRNNTQITNKRANDNVKNNA